MAIKNSFGFDSFLVRFVFALIIIFASYNPEGVSYYHWVSEALDEFSVLKAFIGVILLIGWIIFIRATFMSMGWLGITLGGALFGCVVWLMVDQGWLSLDSEGMIAWIVLVILSLILAVGMSWSHVRRRMSGQFDVDEKDD